MNTLKKLFPSYSSNWKLVLCPLVGVAIGCVLAPRIASLLPAPEPPVGIDRHEPGLRNQALKIGQIVSGSGTEQFVVVEVSDYFCPACRENEDKVASQLSALRHVGRIVVHFPFHPGSEEAAIASLEADKYGVGPEYHRVLMDVPSTDWKPFLESILKKRGLDFNRLRQGQTQATERLKANLELVSRLKIKATPTFFICHKDGSVFQAWKPSGVLKYLRNSGA